MRSYIQKGFLSFALVGYLASASAEQSFTIIAVGASNNTNTVFIDVLESASNTTCENKVHFKLPDDDKNSDRFYSIALAAHAQSKKIVIGYYPDECIHGGILPRTFKISN